MNLNVDGLRPWEWWQADSADLYQIAEIKSAWKEGRAAARSQQAKPTTSVDGQPR
jgi:hypothetical protein